MSDSIALLPKALNAAIEELKLTVKEMDRLYSPKLSPDLTALTEEEADALYNLTLRAYVILGDWSKSLAKVPEGNAEVGKIFNEIELLMRDIKRSYPEAVVDLSPPLYEDGFWSLDIDLREKSLAVEWRQTTGFVFSDPSFETFGENGDERYENRGLARNRIQELLGGK